MEPQRPNFNYKAPQKNDVVHKELECPICVDYLWDPVETPCGHAFCKSCLAGANTYNCPICQQRFKSSQLRLASQVVRRMLDNLPVQCPHSHHGCDWVGARFDTATHSASCEYRDPSIPLKFVVEIKENEQEFVIPFKQAAVVSIAVDWGDGSLRTIIQDAKVKEARHKYLKPGRYSIRVLRQGLSPRNCWLDHLGGGLMLNQDWAHPIVEFTQLGKLGIKSLSRLFAGCTSFNAPLQHLDVSNIVNLSSVFWAAVAFNQPISQWDTSHVTDMSCMFADARSFNQQIDQWNVSRVNNMSHMFQHATTFNQSIGNWNVSNVWSMSRMFCGAQQFNQPIGKWDVSHVVYFSAMFSGATNFNQPIGKWNVARAFDMSNMFREASSFNQPIGGWNVSMVKDFSSMFRGATSFNKPIGGWEVSGVLNMSNMFSYAIVFNQPIEHWDVASVTDMKEMFTGSGFNQPIGRWNISKVECMDDMFKDSKFDQYLAPYKNILITRKNWHDAMFSTEPSWMLNVIGKQSNLISQLESKLDKVEREVQNLKDGKK